MIDGRLEPEPRRREPARAAAPNEISLRQLAKRAPAVMDELQRTGPLIITRHGRPVARLVPLTPGEPR